MNHVQATAIFFAVIDHAGWLNRFQDQRTIKAMIKHGWIAQDPKCGSDARWIYSVTNEGYLAALKHLVDMKDLSGIERLVMGWRDIRENG